jgi:hypothetical protein
LKFFAFILLMSVLLSPLAQADETVFAAGAVGSRWLNIPGSARLAGVAGAFVARTTELGALEVNPAGIAGISRLQGYATHTLGIEGLHADRLAGAFGLGDFGTGAVTVDYLYLGEVENTALDSGGNVVVSGTSQDTALSLAAAWAGVLGPVAFGGALHSLNENLAGVPVAGVATDFGLDLKFLDRWRLGASAQNIGISSDRGLLPLRFRLGGGYTFGEPYPVSLELNSDFSPNDQEPPVWRAAAEWAPASRFLLRGGYILGNGFSPGGPCGGAGWLFGGFEIEYAAYAVGDLGISHVFTLRWVP